MGTLFISYIYGGLASLGVKQEATFRLDSGGFHRKEKNPKENKGNLFHPLLKVVRRGAFMKYGRQMFYGNSSEIMSSTEIKPHS